MTIVNTTLIEIPNEAVDHWQRFVNTLVGIAQADCALIVRYIKDTENRLICISANHPDQYRVGMANATDFCNTACRKQERVTFTSPALSPSNGISAYLGEPVYWPDGSLFGVLSLLRTNGDKNTANGANTFDPLTVESLHCFKNSIESYLTTIFQNNKWTRLNDQLKQRINKRTTDLATLNYSLTSEIEKRKAIEQRLNYQTNHDLSTGFLNHLSLTKGTEQLLVDTKVSSTHLIVFHIIFTNGKKIQERFGEQSLSHLLKEFRQRIGDIDSIVSMTARTSIANMVIAVQTTELNPFIDELSHHIMDTTHTEFVIGEEKIHLHAFVGVATSHNSDDANQLLFYANEAAFSCKETGQCYSYYSHEDNQQQQHKNEIESYLLQAVRNDDLTLYFQPKVELKSGNWIGAEALIRWNHPILGNVSNENLIQMAEQNGLIFEVGNFVLRSAIEHASQWASQLKNFKIAVNVSSIQLKNQHFFDHLQHLLQSYHFPPSCLEIEITESCLISNEHLAKQTLTKLHQLGVTLSLDDFGTGYASFSYLKSYPFNCIKIDKSFIQNINNNQDDKEIVHSIVQIAKRLDLNVTIEGIEDLDQERFVINEGCDYAQGYLYGKPMTGKEFENCIQGG